MTVNETGRERHTTHQKYKKYTKQKILRIWEKRILFCLPLFWPFFFFFCLGEQQKASTQHNPVDDNERGKSTVLPHSENFQWTKAMCAGGERERERGWKMVKTLVLFQSVPICLSLCECLAERFITIGSFCDAQPQIDNGNVFSWYLLQKKKKEKRHKTIYKENFSSPLVSPVFCISVIHRTNGKTGGKENLRNCLFFSLPFVVFCSQGGEIGMKHTLKVFFLSVLFALSLVATVVPPKIFRGCTVSVGNRWNESSFNQKWFSIHAEDFSPRFDAKNKSLRVVVECIAILWTPSRQLA